MLRLGARDYWGQIMVDVIWRSVSTLEKACLFVCLFVWGVNKASQADTPVQSST
jgi:hypothetical protein